MSHRPTEHARELLATADSLLNRQVRLSTGSGPGSSALLVRQAFENLLDVLWGKTSQGMTEVSMRAQLICLPEYLRNDALAGQVAFTWGALSNACHCHPYELTPTAAEVAPWLAAGYELADLLDERYG